MLPLAPEVLEPIRRKLGVANRVLDVLVSQVSLQGSGIVALVGQREAAGMPQHVRMSLTTELGGLASTLHRPGKASGRERRATLGGEHKGRLGILLPRQATQGPHFIAADRVGARRAFLGPADGQGCGIEIDLIPAKVYQLACPEAVPTALRLISCRKTKHATTAHRYPLRPVAEVAGEFIAL